MARLFGIVGNRADLTARVLAFEGEALRVRGKGGPLGWGLAFYQSGEVLLRRRPVDDRDGIDIAALASDVRANLIVGHVRHATVGALRSENTHPFRYRQWVFAQAGTVQGFEGVRERLVATVPEFLRGGIRGDTDAEVVFHVMLSFLHDAGRLDDAVVEPQAMREALRSTLAVIDGTTAEAGVEGQLNLIVSNGEELVAVHRSDAAMAVRTLSGKVDGDMVLGEDVNARRKVPELAQMRFSIVASDFDGDGAQPSTSAPPPRWKAVPERSIVTLCRDDDPRIEPL